MKKRFLAGLLLSFSLFFGSFTGSNAAVKGIVVYPAKFELNFSDNQGKFVSKSLQVENLSNKTVRVKAELQPWTLSKDGELIFLSKPDEHSLDNKIKFNPSEFDIGPKQRQTVRFTVRMPEGQDGEYREIIFFDTITGKSTILSSINKNISVTINFESRIGATIYAYKGKISRNASIMNVKLEKEKKNTYLAVILKNDGNVHTSFDGKAVLSNKLDTNKNIDIPIRYYLMPQSTQKLKIKIPDKFAADKNNVINITLKYLDEKFKEQCISAEADFGIIKPDESINSVSAKKIDDTETNKSNVIPEADKYKNKK